MKNFILFLLILSLSACTVRGTGGTYIYHTPHENISTLIAYDIGKYLSEDNPAGHTTIRLRTPENDGENPFSKILEMEFRNRGYIVSERVDTELVLEYTLNQLENEIYYVHLRYSQYSIARFYTKDGQVSSNWTNLVTDNDTF